MAKRPPPPIAAVAEILAAKPAPTRKALTALRRLVYEAAGSTEGVGPLVETLKWGEPSYLTAESGSGTTVRINAVRNDPAKIAMFVPCQTDLVARYRELYPGLEYEGDRAVRFRIDRSLPEAKVRHMLAMALTYHQRGRS
jgi:hypothetical protein